MIQYFLPMILFLGMITSYEDIKSGKIRNKWILFALIYSLIFNLILTEGFLTWILYSLTALITGFLIWLINFWTAGDAKLFFAFASLIPINAYISQFSFYFYSLEYLINTFLPISLFLIFMMFFKINRSKIIFQLKKSLNFTRILNLILFIFSFMWILRLLFKLLNFQVPFQVTFIFIAVLFILLEKYLPFRTTYLLSLIAVLRLIIDKTIYSLSFLKSFIIIALIMFIIRFIIISLSFDIFTKEKKLKELEQGDIPAELIFRDKNKIKKASLLYSRNISPIFRIRPEGLNKEEIDILHKLKGPVKTLRIQETMSFAPFLFLGALLTIAIRTNILMFIQKLIN